MAGRTLSAQIKFEIAEEDRLDREAEPARLSEQAQAYDEREEQFYNQPYLC